MNGQLGINKKLKIAAGGVLQPCSENLLFNQGVYDFDTGTVSNKVSGGSPALLVNSNAAYFNGTSSKAVCTYTNDILYYLNLLQIHYSLDGETALLWETGDTAVTGLLQIDLVNKTLTFGFDGTSYFEGWIWITIPQYFDGVEYVDIQNFTFASGLTTEEENRSTSENDWVGYLAPMWAEQFYDTELIDLNL